MQTKAPQNDSALITALVLTLRNLKPVAGWIAALLAILYLTSGITTIQPDESGLRLRFGKLTEKVYPPGIVFAAPAPFETIVTMQTGSEQTIHLDAWASSGKKISDPDQIYQPTDQEVADFMAENGGIAPPVRKVEIDGATTLDPTFDGYALTRDRNIIQARFALRYRIVDPKLFYKIADPKPRLLAAILYQAATETISRYNIDECLTTHRENVSIEIAQRASQLSSKFQTGVAIAACELREITPPRQTVAAFEDVVNAQMFARTLLESAHEYRSSSESQTEAKVQSIKLRADTYANDTLAKADGESSAFLSFLSEYKKSPNLIANRLYLETVDYVMEESNSAALFSDSQTRPTIFIEPAPEL